MELVTQSLQLVRRHIITPGYVRSSVRTLSSLHGFERQVKQSLNSVKRNANFLLYNNYTTKYSVVISHARQVHSSPAINSTVDLARRWNTACSKTRRNHRNWNRVLASAQTLAYSTIPGQGTAHLDSSKSLSALQVRRPARKKLPSVADEDKLVQVDNVVAYAVAEDVDLSGLEKHLVKQGVYSIGKLPSDVIDALHVRGKYNVEQKPKEIFVFEDGSVVFWRVPEEERSTFLKLMGRFSQRAHPPSLMLYEREEMDFTYTSGMTCLSGDMIQLKEDDKESQHLEMYTVSNALAQSVKLAMWEASFNKFVVSFENVIEDLREGRKISLSRRQVLMKTGELFTLRHLINLSSDLLDTPDFYWDREALEPLYKSICNYLSISRRTRVMNEKLNHCCELTELLSTQLNDVHHTRLEVMIIVLILVEVVFAIVHAAERYLSTESTDILDEPHLAVSAAHERSPCDCELRALSLAVP